MVFSWQMAEELATAHMQRLGFTDARRTSPGADGGIDVASANAIAQVKYQAAPVGAPAVQMLRGAAHHSPHALFYATSYTRAALAAGEATGVALFVYDVRNQVTAVSAAATALELGADPENPTLDRIRELWREAYLRHQVVTAVAQDMASEWAAQAAQGDPGQLMGVGQQIEAVTALVSYQESLSAEGTVLLESMNGTYEPVAGGQFLQLLNERVPHLIELHDALPEPVRSRVRAAVEVVMALPEN